jgi:hypothetical protein
LEPSTAALHIYTSPEVQSSWSPTSGQLASVLLTCTRTAQRYIHWSFILSAMRPHPGGALFRLLADIWLMQVSAFEPITCLSSAKYVTTPGQLRNPWTVPGIPSLGRRQWNDPTKLVASQTLQSTQAGGDAGNKKHGKMKTVT